MDSWPFICKRCLCLKASSIYCVRWWKTHKGVIATVKHYHNPGWIATSFVSGLWLGWGSPYKYKWVGLEALKGQSTMSVKAWLVVDHLIAKATYSVHFLLNGFKQKHIINYEGTAAFELHRYWDSFGAKPHYQWENQKTLPAKRGR